MPVGEGKQELLGQVTEQSEAPTRQLTLDEAVALAILLQKNEQLEETNNWHSGRHSHPLFYLDFGDLALLITNHWDLFEALFPDQGWVNSRIKETERSRNVIAHTNELPSTEGARMEMHFRDWIAHVG